MNAKTRKAEAREAFYSRTGQATVTQPGARAATRRPAPAAR